MSTQFPTSHILWVCPCFVLLLVPLVAQLSWIKSAADSLRLAGMSMYWCACSHLLFFLLLSSCLIIWMNIWWLLSMFLESWSFFSFPFFIMSNQQLIIRIKIEIGMNICFAHSNDPCVDVDINFITVRTSIFSRLVFRQHGMIILLHRVQFQFLYFVSHHHVNSSSKSPAYACSDPNMSRTTCELQQRRICS